MFRLLILLFAFVTITLAASSPYVVHRGRSKRYEEEELGPEQEVEEQEVPEEPEQMKTPKKEPKKKKEDQKKNKEKKDFNFDCHDRPIGFYADVEDCQYFHLCDEGVRITFSCSNETAFNQQYRVCDWRYNVDCEESPNWYYLNDLTYAADPPKDIKLFK